MRVSIEIPAFKGAWLTDCIESVLCQTSDDWELSVIWDGGDDLARRVVEHLAALQHPRIHAYLGHRRGIARARRFLTERSTAEWILPLDDDDLLAPDAVERFLAFAGEHPHAGIIRARRAFIDEAAALVRESEWFPFEPRRFQHGMLRDLHNHCQPYLISRSAYERTGGWEGFADFGEAGEDCDIFVKIEEVAPVELCDEVLYFYRLHPRRASHDLGPAGAKEMWRRIADRTIARLGLPLRRVGEEPPFAYERLPVAAPSRETMELVIAGSGDAAITRWSLIENGIDDYAMRVLPGAAGSAFQRGFTLARSAYVGFIAAGARVAHGGIDAVAEEMSAAAADLFLERASAGAPPSLLVARRDVLLAIGGFDTRLASAGLAIPDAAMRALRRNFSCAKRQVIAAPAPDVRESEDLRIFARKWPAAAGAAAT